MAKQLYKYMLVLRLKTLDAQPLESSIFWTAIGKYIKKSERYKADTSILLILFFPYGRRRLAQVEDET